MTAINQKEYLKKYLSRGGDSGKKKKRKKKAISDRVKIIDDDIDVTTTFNQAVQEDLNAQNEDAPQIVGVIDERPLELRMSDYHNTDLWKPVGVVGGVGNNVHSSESSDDEKKEYRNRSPSQEAKRNSENRQKESRKSSEDENPPRQKQKDSSDQRNTDASPPRRSQKDNETSARYRKDRRKGDDVSPPRRNRRNSDASPPRSNRRDNDASPVRRSRKDSENSVRYKNRRNNDDVSPPRRNKRTTDASPPRRNRRNSDASPPRTNRRNSDASPPRPKRRNSDTSPQRRRNSDTSPPRRKNSDASSYSRSNRSQSRNKIPPRDGDRRSESVKSYRKSDSDQSRSDERKNKLSRWSRPPSPPPPPKTPDVRKSGLQRANDIIMGKDPTCTGGGFPLPGFSGAEFGNAAPIMRDRHTGRIRDPKQEQEEEKAKKEEREELEAKYAQWGRGLKQVEDANERLNEDLHEMNKPLARYADDEDLERHLKEMERDGDPMLDYLRKKRRKTDIETGKKVKPLFEGEFMPNRYGIRPGHRWDGVDRSNGYEKKWFDVVNARRAEQEEAYKWSTEDM